MKDKKISNLISTKDLFDFENYIFMGVSFFEILASGFQ